METIIFSNYNPWSDYAKSAAISLLDQGIENPSEEEILEEVYNLNSEDWSSVKESLEEFFDNDIWIARGTVGRWDGKYEAGFIFCDLDELFSKACKDCNYWEISEKKGHLFLKCSHHDGDNFFEIKKITDRGLEFLDNWENGYRPLRTERTIHDSIMRNYTVLPRYLEHKQDA